MEEEEEEEGSMEMLCAYFIESDSIRWEDVGEEEGERKQIIGGIPLLLCEMLIN